MFRCVCVSFFLCSILLLMCHIWRFIRLYWRLFSHQKAQVRCSLLNCLQHKTQSLWPSRVGACWWCVCQRSPSLCLPLRSSSWLTVQRAGRCVPICPSRQRQNRKDMAQGANIFPSPWGWTSRVTRFLKPESGCRGGSASVLIHGFNCDV